MLPDEWQATCKKAGWCGDQQDHGEDGTSYKQMSQYDDFNERDFANDEASNPNADNHPPEQHQPVEESSDEDSEGVGATTPPESESTPDIVNVLRELLGPNAVLLPVPKAEKGPIFKGWNKIRLEDTQNPEYRAQLLCGNIGVLLGEASAGLCAIDIDDDAAVEPFLALNPQLRTTTATRGQRGQQIWVKVLGGYPPVTKLKTQDGRDWGEWRATGGQSVIHGIHKETKQPYSFVCNAKPIEIRFQDINWPQELGSPFALHTPEFTDLTKRFGPPFEISDNGAIRVNHQWFVHRYLLEHLVIFDPAQKEFFEYAAVDGLWKRQTEDRVKTQFLDDLTDAAHRFSQPGLLMKLNDGLAGALTRMLRGKIEKTSVFDDRKPVIHVQNGVLRFDVEPPTLVSFSPEFYSRNQCPLEFDPNATCPRFQKELLESALDPDDIDLVKRWAGSCMLGVNIAQRLLMLRGTPGGGKSTLMAVIEKVIGLQNVALLRTEQLAERFELSAFSGRTLLTGKDVSPTFLMRKGAHVLKGLIGGDLLDAEKKGVNERLQIRGNFNVGITCNSQLKVKLEGDAGAWERRLMIVDYNKPKPAKPEPGFAERLIREEGQGILFWMVQGAQQLLEEIREYGDYRLSAVQIDRVQQLLAESDSVRQFVQECVVVDPDATVTSSELLSAYSEYCEDKDWEGFDSFDAAKKLPHAMLEVHGAKHRKDILRNNKAVRGYKGFALVGGV